MEFGDELGEDEYNVAGDGVNVGCAVGIEEGLHFG